MCGLTGFLVSPTIAEDKLKAMANRMAKAIGHRGPDDHGAWADSQAGIALGHRRLAIVDLSPTGHQPMQSDSGRYMIVFNGEIYNYLSLRHALGANGKAPIWRGHSDAWGIQGAIEKSVGMFAFAVWDRQANTLTLGRDRLGEKPLYYGWQGQGKNAAFLFGSELKALRAHPAFENNINRGALTLQLRHSSIPAPHCIYEGIYKLLPGRLLTVSLQQRDLKSWQYWSGAQVAEYGALNSFEGNADKAVDELEALLKDSVRRQIMADVPVGAFLSGGVDSSTIVALMQAQSSQPVKTFTIGFNEESYNEAVHAKVVARHLGTDHTELYVTPRQARAVIPHLPTLYDEPFSDSSQIPTFLVSQLAKKQVTVSLSGDAGDELFCGYNRYKITANLWSRLAAVPLPLRRLVAMGLTAISPQLWDKLAGSLARLMSLSSQFRNVGDKLHKGAGVLASRSSDALYFGLVSNWHDPASVVIDGHEPSTLLTSNLSALNRLDGAQRMMLQDMLTYLPDDILTKVDRAAMGVSLETRVPFLDHRVVEFAWRLPQTMKLRNGQTKWILRQVLYRHVPKELIERPKMGFGIPIDNWIRGPLREWAESLLCEKRLRQEGYFHSAPIRQKWVEHLSGQRNWQHHLWDVLVFQSWLEENK